MEKLHQDDEDPRKFKTFSFPESIGLTGQAFQGKKTVAWNHYQALSKFDKLIDNFTNHTELHSLVCTEIHTYDDFMNSECTDLKTIGAIQFLNKKSLDGENSHKINIKDKTIIEAARALFGGIIGNISLKKVVALVCLNVIQN